MNQNNQTVKTRPHALEIEGAWYITNITLPVEDRQAAIAYVRHHAPVSCPECQGDNVQVYDDESKRCRDCGATWA